MRYQSDFPLHLIPAARHTRHKLRKTPHTNDVLRRKPLLGGELSDTVWSEVKLIGRRGCGDNQGNKSDRKERRRPRLLGETEGEEMITLN